MILFPVQDPPLHNENKGKIMSTEETSLGSIHISPNAVATIAYHAVYALTELVGLPRKIWHPM